MSKKVLVLMGGFSAEREVSLNSGQGAAAALAEAGYMVISHDLQNTFEFIDVLRVQKPDAVFNALHGNWGEDGEIQALLDLLQIPYTHSGLKTSAIGMDKLLTKKIAQDVGINIATDERMNFGDFKNNQVEMAMPYVVKAISEGSSVGVFIVKSEQDLEKVFYENDNDEIMIEKFIEGREFTVAVLDDKALELTELVSSNEFYDYNAKYTDGITQHILPANVDDDVRNTCFDYALKIHESLGCNTVSRSDFRYNEKDGVVFLEVNTNPGLTSLSLVPEQAKYVGISYQDLCVKLVECATCRKM